MELLDVKTDNRGSLLKFKLGNKKFLIVLTKKGFLRGGETHNMSQRTILAEGEIEVITKQKNKNIVKIYEGIEEFYIPKNIPHYFKFLEDSIIMEYEDENMTREYYPEYRKIVEESMK